MLMPVVFFVLSFTVEGFHLLLFLCCYRFRRLPPHVDVSQRRTTHVISHSPPPSPFCLYVVLSVVGGRVVDLKLSEKPGHAATFIASAYNKVSELRGRMFPLYTSVRYSLRDVTS